jgi:hypothetical protein
MLISVSLQLLNQLVNGHGRCSPLRPVDYSDPAA